MYEYEEKNVEEKITVLKIEVGKLPELKEIPNQLKAMQEEVDGLIEVVYLGDDALAIVNEEGRINGMEPNRYMGDEIICGPFFICGDTNTGDFASLSTKQIQKYMTEFSFIPEFTGDEPELEPRAFVWTFDFR